jgi:hypothetical protein
MARIGVISSVELGQALRTKFENGVGGHHDIRYADNLGYKPRKLHNKVQHFNQRADLIVTVGGGVSLEAALFCALRPFVSLVGGLPASCPTPPFKNFFAGALSLESYEQNQHRMEDIFQHRAGLHGDPDQVCLVFNPNSRTAVVELANWPGADPVPIGVDADGENDETAFGFGAVTVHGVVVSADPFFYNHRDELIAAANAFVALNALNYVSYPLQNYANTAGAHQPTPGSATLYGPSLEDEHERLGQMAADVLGGRPPGLVKATQVRQPI